MPDDGLRDVDAAPTKVLVNGESRTLAVAMLDQALIELGYGGSRVATAVNGNFVPVAKRSAYILGTGDRIEVVAARAGG
jgi:sulfur carrier protein